MLGSEGRKPPKAAVLVAISHRRGVTTIPWNCNFLCKIVVACDGLPQLDRPTHAQFLIELQRKIRPSIYNLSHVCLALRMHGDPSSVRLEITNSKVKQFGHLFSTFPQLLAGEHRNRCSSTVDYHDPTFSLL